VLGVPQDILRPERQSTVWRLEDQATERGPKSGIGRVPRPRGLERLEPSGELEDHPLEDLDPCSQAHIRIRLRHLRTLRQRRPAPYSPRFCP
jgi:hypothetical protein